MNVETRGILMIAVLAFNSTKKNNKIIINCRAKPKIEYLFLLQMPSVSLTFPLVTWLYSSNLW